MTQAPSSPDFSIETAARAQGFLHIAGVDEVGRGPLAGPVTAAAVILDPQSIPDGINDSKRLRACDRNRLAGHIKSGAQAWAIAHATVAEIDTINILQASHLAMLRALQALGLPADYVLVDGNRRPKGLTVPAQAVIKGDAKSLSIAAASILAKVERDRIMQALAREYPQFGWAQNAGYPTKAHREALKTHGVTPHHRITFKPIRNMLCEEN